MRMVDTIGKNADNSGYRENILHKFGRTCRLAVLVLFGIICCDLFAADIPFPDSLQAANINQDRLDNVMDNSLILGNGDINGLIWSEENTLVLTLTKNDVWDARLDTTNDPPLPTLARIKELGCSGKTFEKTPIGQVILPEGVTWSGRDSYHSHPYPCPRACARLILGEPCAKPMWRKIRGEGTHNAWERRGNAMVMSIKGQKEASNGYAFGPLDFSTDDYPVLRVKLSGSENARYFIDVKGQQNKVVFSSRWIESPTQSQECTFKLASGHKVTSLILYTWTEDGAMAENQFESVVFEGNGKTVPIDMNLAEFPSTPSKLDIRRAVVHVAGCSGGPPNAELRALIDRNVFLFESKAQARLSPVISSDIPAAVVGEREGVAFVHQIIPGDLDWQGMSFAVALATNGNRKAVAIVTSMESRDVVNDAIVLANSTLREDAAGLVRRHDEIWERFWAHSGLDLKDEVLQSTWYRSLYFLRCVSKPGVVCPGLFAGLINDTPAWHGDYHTNYNLQQIFWGAYSANHPDLAEPYDRLMLEYLPRARWLARQVFAMQGAYYPHVLFAYEPPNPEMCKSRYGRQYIHHVWGMTLGVAGFSVQPVWWHYKYAPSREFLGKTAYPLVRDVALMYAEFVEHCEGGDKVVLGPSVSPEHWGWTPGLDRNRNCAFDIAMLRYILEAAIEGANTLGCDNDLIERFQKALRRLPSYPLHGDVKPVVVDVEGAPPIGYNISVPATPVFPGDVVTWLSPSAERELFTRTIETMKWNGNNATMMLAVSRARMGMPDTQEWLRDEIKARMRPNGTLALNRLKPRQVFNDFGHYTEQFGAAMAISELLLQSVGDIIRVFPALSKEKDAKFTNLRTQGGFLVSTEQKDGKVTRLEIVSTVGGKLQLLGPWPMITVKRNNDKPEILQMDTRGIVTLNTVSDERLVFSKGE